MATAAAVLAPALEGIERFSPFFLDFFRHRRRLAAYRISYVDIWSSWTPRFDITIDYYPHGFLNCGQTVH